MCPDSARVQLIGVFCVVVVTAGCVGQLVGPAPPYPGSVIVEPVNDAEGLDKSVSEIKGTNHTFAPVVNFSAIQHPVVKRAIRKADATGNWTRVQYNATVRHAILNSFTGQHVPLIVWYNGTAWTVTEAAIG